MSWYSLSTSTSSMGTHRYATRHAAAPLWDFCVPCIHISSRRSYVRLLPILGGGDSHAAHCQTVTAAQSQGPGGVGSVGYVEVAGHEDVKLRLQRYKKYFNKPHLWRILTRFPH